jgi:septal ring factor EnvC (AmiA/AmiB activator)
MSLYISVVTGATPAMPVLRSAIAALVLVCVLHPRLGAGQAPQPADAAQDQLAERLRTLEREATQLAARSRSLVAELRQLERVRDQRRQALQTVEAAVAESATALQRASERVAALERERVAQLPDLKTQLVNVYKNGRSGYARMLFDVTGLRDFARATRAMTSLTAINQKRIEEHRRTLAALQAERRAIEQRTRQLRTEENAARRARAEADAAIAAHTALIDEIDSKRDLAAQYVGELQVAYDELQKQFKPGVSGTPAAAAPAAASGGSAAGATAMASLRGSLPWPVAGQVSGRFGQSEGRLGGTAVRNGMEFSAPEGAAVRAVQAGTVSFADEFAGFGTLVIVDHGANNYSLYGYLGSVSAQRGAQVAAGAELGRVGLSPAGPPALYFEMRIDGRSVDPLQWLQPAGGR